MAFDAGFAVFLALLVVLVVSVGRYSRRLGRPRDGAADDGAADDGAADDGSGRTPRRGR